MQRELDISDVSSRICGVVENFTKNSQFKVNHLSVRDGLQRANFTTSKATLIDLVQRKLQDSLVSSIRLFKTDSAGFIDQLGQNSVRTLVSKCNQLKIKQTELAPLGDFLMKKVEDGTVVMFEDGSFVVCTIRTDYETICKKIGSTERSAGIFEPSV